MKEIAKTGLQILQQTRYTPGTKPDRGSIIISIDNQCICSLQNFITLSAMEKGGKGKFIAPIIAGAIMREPVWNIRTRLPEGRSRIALLDTEQGDFNFYGAIENIEGLIGSSMPDNFDAYKLRENEPEEILRAANDYLAAYPDCSLMVIDGFLDLTYTMNDDEKCARLIKYIMNLTEKYNCAIVGTLHRAKTTNMTIGQLGSFANRKAQSVLLIEKNQERGSITLKPEKLRDAHTFDTIEIIYNRNTGAWEQTLALPDEDEKKIIRIKQPKPEELAEETHKKHVRRIFYADHILKYQEIIDGICENYGIGQTKAKQVYFPYLIEQAMLFHVKGGYVNQRERKMFVENNG